MRIITYDETYFLENLTDNDFVNLKQSIVLDITNFVGDLEALNEIGLCADRTEEMLRMYSLSLVENTLREIEEITTFKDFMKKISNNMIKRIINIEGHVIKSLTRKVSNTLETYRIIFYKKLKKSFFKFFLWHKKGDFVLKVDKLYFHQLLVITKNVVGVIYNQTEIDKNRIRNDFGIKIIQENDYQKCSFRTMSREAIVDNKFTFYNINNQIKENGINFKKRNIVDLRIMFNENHYHPNISFITEYIKTNIVNGSKVYIIYPLFIDTKSSILLSRKHGYFNIFYMFVGYYIKLMEEIVKLSDSYKISIVIPNKIDFSCYLKWRVLILNSCKQLGYSNVPVGVLLDDFDMQYDIEYYENTDFVIIDFDELAYNLVNDKNELSKERFDEEMLVPLRLTHSFLKENRIKHIIMSKHLRNKYIMEKLLMLGYTEYIYSDANIPTIIDVMGNYMSRRGKFIGITKGKNNKVLQK